MIHFDPNAAITAMSDGEYVGMGGAQTFDSEVR